MKDPRFPCQMINVVLVSYINQEVQYLQEFAACFILSNYSFFSLTLSKRFFMRMNCSASSSKERLLSCSCLSRTRS